MSSRWNFETPDVPYIKDWFGTRIMYSDIHINDAYKNGFRVFQGTNYRDYTREYGEIVKLISLESSLLCVFEHGIGIVPVNQKALLSTTTGQSIHLYGSGVLQSQVSVVSEDFGSVWQDSIIKTPLGVYGIDTYAKKI